MGRAKTNNHVQIAQMLLATNSPHKLLGLRLGSIRSVGVRGFVSLAGEEPRLFCFAQPLGELTALDGGALRSRRVLRIELRIGEFGVEAQIFEGGDLLVGRRFDTRQLAVNWAELEKADLETGGDLEKGGE